MPVPLLATQPLAQVPALLQTPQLEEFMQRLLPGMQAAAYVAMSRVQRDNEYLLGGIVTQAHVVPNA